MTKIVSIAKLASVQYKHINGGNPPLGYTAVAFNEPLTYFEPKVFMRDGQLVQRYNEMTVKDCRNIDKCVYFAPGKVSDGVMTDWIIKFQKAYSDPNGEWVEVKEDKN